MPQQSLIACRAIHEVHRHLLLGRHDVVGTAVGFRRRNGELTDQRVVKIFVTRKIERNLLHEAALLPSTLRYGASEVEIDVEELEPPMVPMTPKAPPRPADPHLVMARRPVSGGFSVSHWDFPIGTVAVGVEDLVYGAHCVLSCNHVLARMNHGYFGDAALQPAPDDGGFHPGEAIGALLRYIPVMFDGSHNVVDAAIAACWPGEVSNQVHGLGAIHESAPPWTISPGDKVSKVGRTTGLTHGTVVAVDATVKPNYGPLGFENRPVLFTDQIVVDIHADYGDSGSLLVDSRNRAIGMLFGGTPHHTWFNPFTAIEQKLLVRLLPHRYAWI